jgi:hypothetical protein
MKFERREQVPQAIASKIQESMAAEDEDDE